MDNKTQYIAAVDIGTTKIVSLVGKKNENGKLEILAMSKTPSKGVKRGVVLNIEDTVNAIKNTVEAVKLKSGIDFSEVLVGIAGQHIRSIRNRGYINRDSYDDEITQADIDSLIKDMYKIPIDVGEEIIHVLPQNYIVDNETGVKQPVGMSGKRIEGNFHIVIGQITSARNMEKCINRCELNIKKLVLEQLASSMAVLTEDEKEAGVALVDIGGGTTDVAVYYDGMIQHTAVIPFGGNVVTSDIKEGCAILTRQAEQLKMQFGSALGDMAPENKVITIPGISGREPKEISFVNLAYIIQSRMEEIIDTIAFEIESSGCMEKLSAGIVLTGGGSMLKNLKQLVNYKTGMDVRIGYPINNIMGDTENEINQPMFATSVGLLLQGFEYTKNEDTGDAEEKTKKINHDKPGEMKITGKIKNKGKLLDNLKRTFTDFFEENDTEM